MTISKPTATAKTAADLSLQGIPHEGTELAGLAVGHAASILRPMSFLFTVPTYQAGAIKSAPAPRPFFWYRKRT
jgi:hypothetical protein